MAKSIPGIGRSGASTGCKRMKASCWPCQKSEERPTAMQDMTDQDGFSARNGQLPNVTQLVTGSSDNRIKIWDVLPSVPAPAVTSTALPRDQPFEAQRRDLERLSLDSNPPASLASTPTIASTAATAAASTVVGIEAASILSSAPAATSPRTAALNGPSFVRSCASSSLSQASRLGRTQGRLSPSSALPQDLFPGTRCRSSHLTQPCRHQLTCLGYLQSQRVSFEASSYSSS